jgi:6-phospho-beta-glucosidase
MSAEPPGRPLPLAWSAIPDDPARPLSVAVVGGSTPFASRLFDAMAVVAAPDGSGTPGPPLSWDLRLIGRDERALALVAAHARELLPAPHRVSAATEGGPGLDRCDVVVVQPRVGGLGERAADERLGAEVGAPADEGLGPGGARAIIRSAPALRGLAADLRRRCPDAFVIAFSNPLSATVSVLHAAGAPSAGVCELPLVTAYEIADRLGAARERLSWSLTGLSHRGFVHDISLNGEDLLEPLVAALRSSGATIGGIGADTIEQLGSVPLKYHAMLSGASRPAAGRAEALQAIRAAALDELARDPAAPPQALAQRSMPWYHEAVLPVVAAVAGRPVRAHPPHVLNLMCEDGLVREVVAELGPDGVTALSPPPLANAEAQSWLRRFTAHERATNDFLAAPGPDSLATMLAADPATPDDAVEAAARALAPEVARLAETPVAQSWLRA